MLTSHWQNTMFFHNLNTSTRERESSLVIKHEYLPGIGCEVARNLREIAHSEEEDLC